MAMIVADTGVLIDALRGREPGRSRIALELQTGRLATTSITAFELWAGAATDREQAKVRDLLDALLLIPFNGSAARFAGDVKRRLDDLGTPIGMADCLIAGICLDRRALLLTRDRTHFERVEGLTLGRLTL